MSLYSTWEASINEHATQESQEVFWREYLAKEQTNYETILASKDPILKGTIKELAEKFAMDEVTFVGFLDGINTSLETALDLESLDADTEINSTILWDELYKNMLDVKADWLYDIEAWDGIYSEGERKALKKVYNKSKIVVNEEKIGRNDPCPCGSGKKYKKCCLNK